MRIGGTRYLQCHYCCSLIAYFPLDTLWNHAFYNSTTMIPGYLHKPVVYGSEQYDTHISTWYYTDTSRVQV